MERRIRVHEITIRRFKTAVKLVAINLVVLEVLVQMIFLILGGDCVKVGSNLICLMPNPLVTEQQAEVLADLVNDAASYYQFDSVLGWTIRPGASEEQGGTVYTSNSIGIRASREYTLNKDACVTRIAAFGDSFTHANGVSNDEMWTRLLEIEDPDIEVMNWGVGGYGTDQAWLRYKVQGAKYYPDVVLIGFMVEDIRRNVNRFRPFYSLNTGMPLTKPVFLYTEDDLVLEPNPMSSAAELLDYATNRKDEFLNRVCEHDIHCHREEYETSPLDVFKSFRLIKTAVYKIKNWDGSLDTIYQDDRYYLVTYEILRRFAEEVTENGSKPLIVLLPPLSTLERYNETGVKDHQRLIDQLEVDGLPFIDLTDDFIEAKRTLGVELGGFFGGHYNSLGNVVVKEAVLRWISAFAPPPTCE